jgi:ribosomal protein S18 acetylase RimI-like enzyme
MVLIRKAEFQNLDNLLALAIKIFIEAFESQNNPDDFKSYTDEAFNKEKFTEEFYEEGSQFFEVFDDENLIGYARLRENNEVDHYLGKNHIELQRIYIDSPYHGRGMANQLLNACEEHALLSGKEWIWLGVWEHNPKAQQFYRKHGYEKFSEHKFMVGQDEQTDWLMRKKLINQ